MPSSDWADERDRETSADTTTSGFARYANHDCVFCSEVTGRKTAEMLYMSQEWDYYYCYKCRGWFKRYFLDPKVFLPVRERSEVRRLTWFYVTHVESLHEWRKFRDRVESVWRVVDRRLPHV
ncbi:MAG: hypothetical protein OK454_05860 [Thaumarchaeota archaeon]|nr:hypothetical protein [Nitrososphaerota archaeon]MDA4135461.1 hypothetical protein [Nitrososphaerota archaeon]